MGDMLQNRNNWSKKTIRLLKTGLSSLYFLLTTYDKLLYYGAEYRFSTLFPLPLIHFPQVLCTI